MRGVTRLPEIFSNDWTRGGLNTPGGGCWCDNSVPVGGRVSGRKDEAGFPGWLGPVISDPRLSTWTTRWSELVVGDAGKWAASCACGWIEGVSSRTGGSELSLSFSSSGWTLEPSPEEEPGRVWDWNQQIDNTLAALEVEASIISGNRCATRVSVGGGGGETTGL